MELNEFMAFLAKEAPEVHKNLSYMNLVQGRIYLNDVTGCRVTQSCAVSDSLEQYRDAIIAGKMVVK